MITKYILKNKIRWGIISQIFNFRRRGSTELFVRNEFFFYPVNFNLLHGPFTVPTTNNILPQFKSQIGFQNSVQLGSTPWTTEWVFMFGFLLGFMFITQKLMSP